VNCATKHGIPLRTKSVEFQSLASMEQFVARRPIHTALATTKFTSLTGRALRPWHDAVEDFVRTHIALH
jgi:dTDP-4-dehydrorhamnose reductase